MLALPLRRRRLRALAAWLPQEEYCARRCPLLRPAAQPSHPAGPCAWPCRQPQRLPLQHLRRRLWRPADLRAGGRQNVGRHAGRHRVLCLQPQRVHRRAVWVYERRSDPSLDRRHHRPGAWYAAGLTGQGAALAVPPGPAGSPGAASPASTRPARPCLQLTSGNWTAWGACCWGWGSPCRLFSCYGVENLPRGALCLTCLPRVPQ